MASITRRSTEIVPVQKESDHEDLVKQLERLAEAAGKNKNATRLARELEDKNWFSILTGNLTGENQKNLAGMVEDLGGSLEIVQVAIEVVMKLHMSKHRVLKDFHDALVNKITNIANDTVTLDGNHHETTLFILDELRVHVEAQIRYREQIDDHNDQIILLNKQIRDKTLLDASRDEAHAALQRRYLAFAEQQTHLNKIHNACYQDVQSSMRGLRETVREYQEKALVLEMACEKNATRIAELERQKLEGSRIKALIGRQLLPLISTCLSIVAITLYFTHWLH